MCTPDLFESYRISSSSTTGTIDFNYWIDATSIQGRPLFEGGFYFFRSHGNSECYKRPLRIQVCMDSCKWQSCVSYQRTIAITVMSQHKLQLSA